MIGSCSPDRFNYSDPTVPYFGKFGYFPNVKAKERLMMIVNTFSETEVYEEAIGLNYDMTLIILIMN